MTYRITVIPCVKLPRQLGFFDYTYTEPLLPGTFVQIPFRSKHIVGVVVTTSTEGVTEKLKPVTHVRTDLPALPVEEMNYITTTAQHYCTSPATVLQMLYPAPLTKEKKRPIQVTQIKPKAHQSSLIPTTHPTLFHYQYQTECIQWYRDQIRTAQKKNERIIIITPTQERLHYLLSLLPHSDTLHFYDPTQGIRHTRTIRERITNNEWVVVVGSRALLGLPYPQLTTIIIDQSEHRNHKLHEGSVLFDTCTSAYHKAKSYRSRLVYASHAPRLEEYSWLSCVHPSMSEKPSPVLISLDDEFKGGNRSYISDRLHEEMQQCLKNNSNVVLSLNHSGMSKYVMCKGCNHTFSCPTCFSPLRYTQKGQVLSCLTCDYRQTPPDQCPVCRDVNFMYPGLGIEKIAQQLVHNYKDTPIILIDAANPTLPTTNIPSIIIGTSYLPQHYPHCIQTAGLIGLIAVDPIISLEQFRSQEQQWQDHTLFLSLMSEETHCVIQAFNTSHPFVQSIAQYNYHTFADNEETLRTKHGLPPARRHIACIYKGKPQSEADEVKALVQRLKTIEYDPIDISSTLPIVTVLPKSLTRKFTTVIITIEQPGIPSQILPTTLHANLMQCASNWLIDLDPRIL